MVSQCHRYPAHCTTGGYHHQIGFILGCFPSNFSLISFIFEHFLSKIFKIHLQWMQDIAYSRKQMLFSPWFLSSLYYKSTEFIVKKIKRVENRNERAKDKWTRKCDWVQFLTGKLGTNESVKSKFVEIMECRQMRHWVFEWKFKALWIRFQCQIRSTSLDF